MLATSFELLDLRLRGNRRVRYTGRASWSSWHDELEFLYLGFDVWIERALLVKWTSRARRWKLIVLGSLRLELDVYDGHTHAKVRKVGSECKSALSPNAEILIQS